MKKALSILSLTLGLSLLLSACGPGQMLGPTLTPTTPSTPTITPTPTTTPLPPAVEAIEMQCEDFAIFNNGAFQAQNNTWGKGSLKGWTQCIGMNANPDGSLAARWSWDWPKEGTGVKSYPEIVYGQKPGGPSTDPALPLRLNEVASARVDYSVDSSNKGKNNLAFDLWLTDTDNPTTFGVPPITHEVMIWVDGWDKMAPGGSWVEKVEIDGRPYMVFVANGWGDGWRYVAFVSTETLYGEQSFEIASFLNYMVENDLASGEEYLASIEFGNEVVDGTGDTILSRYEISVEKK